MMVVLDGQLSLLELARPLARLLSVVFLQIHLLRLVGVVVPSASASDSSVGSSFPSSAPSSAFVLQQQDVHVRTRQLCLRLSGLLDIKP